MKKVLTCAALAVALCAGTALAEGQPSPSKLAKLGLGSLQTASDVDGQQVRGEGFGGMSIFFTLNTTIGVGNTASAVGTQSNVFGQDAQTLGVVTFGGTGFGGFQDNTAPNFSTFVSTPITVNSAGGGNTAVSSIQGFMWGAGR